MTLREKIMGKKKQEVIEEVVEVVEGPKHPDINNLEHGNLTYEEIQNL